MKIIIFFINVAIYTIFLIFAPLYTDQIQSFFHLITNPILYYFKTLYNGENGEVIMIFLVLPTLVIVFSLLFTFFENIVYINYKYFIKKENKYKKKIIIYNITIVLFIFLNFAGNISTCWIIPDNEGRSDCQSHYINKEQASQEMSCDKIENYNDKKICFENICKDKKNIISQDKCYKDIGIKINEIELCNKIETPIEKDWCYGGIADNTGNSDLCDEIKDNWPKDICYSKVVKETKDINTCNKITKRLDRNKCIYNLAKATDNVEICDIIVDDQFYDTRESCYFDLAVSTNNEKLCSKISDISSNSFCLKSIAIKTKNEKICATKAIAKSFNDECYREVAVEKNDYKICDNILNITVKDWCYTDVIPNQKNPELCNLINDSKYKNRCIQNSK